MAHSLHRPALVEWSLRHGLAVRHLRGYFAPVHLTSRDGAPELVAPIQVQANRLLVRAIEPRAAYAAARAVVERREELPAWLLDAWEIATDVDRS